MKEFKWFWAWEDEKEEAWLHEMALVGNHLESVDMAGIYVFKEGKPSNAYYRLDFCNQQAKDYNAYLESFKTAGWQHVGKMSRWQYFRKTVKGNEEPELFNNNNNKADKYQRVMTFLVGFLPVMLLWFPLLDDRLHSPFYEILGALFIVLLVVFTFSTFKIYQRINQLRDL